MVTTWLQSMLTPDHFYETPTFQPEFDLLLIFDRIHRVGSSSARQTTSVTHELSARTTTRQNTEVETFHESE